MSSPADLWDELAGPRRPLFLVELAGVLGGLVYVELAGHERLGRLAASLARSGDAAGAVWASAASLAHAWRAAQLERLLPVSRGLPDAASVTVCPGPATAEWVERLELSNVDRLYAELSGFYAELSAAYARRLAFVHASADGPVVTTLERLVADLSRFAESSPAGSRSQVTEA